jgi:hypothetical protein
MTPDVEKLIKRVEAAQAIIDRESKKPRRVYLGEGIWWTPSASFWRSKLGHSLSLEETK